ncbi:MULTISPECIES: hypothetical protein [unclassified Streptomyces]|uniref:hypothetical protein n=1 Tax=unclassified Streptomyces TaxID=2593676 RepID=UPI002256FB16|nr:MULTISPECIES: hypothetical protein [unclassified Streptomyces]MCX4398860.1 hypothetical protein [Streptomyces sp. NBC_01767]WSP51149.1 hypothetical protein OG348_37920 [Streptomyces sp. NBC_01243]
MIEPIRRGRLQLPSEQFHGTSFDIAAVGIQDDPGSHVAVRLSAVLAAFILTWTVVSGTEVEAAQSAFIVTLLGFTWHASAYFCWGRGQ